MKAHDNIDNHITNEELLTAIESDIVFKSERMSTPCDNIREHMRNE